MKILKQKIRGYFARLFNMVEIQPSDKPLVRIAKIYAHFALGIIIFTTAMSPILIVLGILMLLGVKFLSAYLVAVLIGWGIIMYIINA